jgi:hypothetical protein
MERRSKDVNLNSYSILAYLFLKGLLGNCGEKYYFGCTKTDKTMGRIEDGINGPFRGKVGSVIGSSWRKINYIKGLPRFKNKRPPTPEQLLQRRKFALLNRFLDPLSSILEVGFRSFTGRVSGRNAAFTYNYDSAFIVEGTDVRLNYPVLQLSHGSLFTAGEERAWLMGSVLHVQWDPETYGMGRAMDDEARIVVYDELKETFRWAGSAARHEGIKLIEGVDYAIKPVKLHVWIFFVEKNGRRVSKTVYVPVADQDV